MKILRLIYDWPPPWQGLAPHPYELTVAQTKLGHTFDVFCGRWPKAGIIEEPEGVKCHPVFRAPIRGTMLLTSAVIVFFKYLFWRDEPKNAVHIIHSHGHFGIWVYLYRSLLKKFFPKALELRTPLVVHFHNTVIGRWESLKENNMYIQPISKYLDWPLAQYSDKLAVQVADACIFVSAQNKAEAIKHYGADPLKCFVIESGVNVEQFRSIDGEEFVKTRKDLGFEPDDKIVLYQGAVVERKNVHQLIHALRYLPEDYKLLMVGTGEDEYETKITQIIKDHNLGDRIVRAGYTPYPNAHISFQASDVFVLPSTFEGFPKVVIQSLSTGVPALVSGFKASQAIQGLYYLEDNQPETIARQIREIIEGPEAKTVDVDLIHKNYSWESRAAQVDEIYKFLVKKYLENK